MKLGIINSAFEQAGVDLATGLRHISEIGFDTVDIQTEAATLSKQEVARSGPHGQPGKAGSADHLAPGGRRWDWSISARSCGISILRRCGCYIDLARTWGARNILLVLGEYVWQREVIPCGGPVEAWGDR